MRKQRVRVIVNDLEERYGHLNSATAELRAATLPSLADWMG
jgi:hypothetical protein